MHMRQARMGRRAAHESHVAHAGQSHVADILAATAQEPIVFLAKRRGSDSKFVHPELPAASHRKKAFAST
jgi:hypothetical protein